MTAMALAATPISCRTPDDPFLAVRDSRFTSSGVCSKPAKTGPCVNDRSFQHHRRSYGENGSGKLQTADRYSSDSCFSCRPEVQYRRHWSLENRNSTSSSSSSGDDVELQQTRSRSSSSKQTSTGADLTISSSTKRMSGGAADSGEESDDDGRTAAVRAETTKSPLSSPPPPLRHHLLFPPLDDVIGWSRRCDDFVDNKKAAAIPVNAHGACDSSRRDSSAVQRSVISFAAASGAADDVDVCRDDVEDGEQHRKRDFCTRSLDELRCGSRPADGSNQTASVTRSHSDSTNISGRSLNCAESWFVSKTKSHSGSASSNSRLGYWTRRSENRRASQTKSESIGSANASAKASTSRSKCQLRQRTVNGRNFANGHRTDCVVNSSEMTKVSDKGSGNSGGSSKNDHVIRRRRHPASHVGDATSPSVSNFRTSDGNVQRLSSSSYSSDCSSSMSSSESKFRLPPKSATSSGGASSSVGSRRSGLRLVAAASSTLTSTSHSAQLLPKCFRREEGRAKESTAASGELETSTDHQAWDEYQVTPYSSDGQCDGDGVVENELDYAGSLAQNDWSLRRSSDCQVLSSSADSGAIWRMAQLPAWRDGTLDQVRRRLHLANDDGVRKEVEIDAIANGEFDGRLRSADYPATTAGRIRRRDLGGFNDPNETTDSDAEDLEQLIEDSRRALQLTIAALEAARHQTKDAVQGGNIMNESAESRRNGFVKVGGRSHRQSRSTSLREEAATCKTNVECLEPLIDALNHGTSRDVSKTTKDEACQQLADLLMQWKRLEFDIAQLVASTTNGFNKQSINTATASAIITTKINSLKSRDQFQSGTANSFVGDPPSQRSSIISMAPSMATSVSAADAVVHGNVRHGNDVRGWSTMTTSNQNGLLHEMKESMSADATMVDETRGPSEYREAVGNPRLVSPKTSLDMDDYSTHIILNDMPADLESLEPRKRRPSTAQRVCNGLARSCTSSGGNSRLLRTFLLTLFCLVLVAYIVHRWTSSVHVAGCKFDGGGLPFELRLRYVRGPPPI